MALSNRERVQRALHVLRDGLSPFVKREVEARLGERGRPQAVEQEPNEEPAAHAGRLLGIMSDTWLDAFAATLGSVEHGFVIELRNVADGLARERPFSSDDADRALDTMKRLLDAVSAGTQAASILEMRLDLQRTVFAEQARNKTRYQLSLEGMPSPGLKPWREVVTPHPDVASGRYMQAEFAADLAQVHQKLGSDEYRDPAEFFRRTFITAGLEDLLVGALQRLTNAGGDPVVELQTNFGGGKTHSMLALYHLFGGTPSNELFGMERVLEKAGVARAPQANRAVLVGTHLSPGQIVPKSDGTMVRTLWGELAWQLGGSAGYKLVSDSDAQGVSPGSGVLAELFRRHAPALVLIDEWVAYARQLVGKRDLPAGDFEAQSSFAQALTEAAKAAPGTLVVASLPSSKIEIGGDNGEFALATLQDVFERVGKPWRPANADEGFEIVRRRLFEPPRDKTAFAHRDAVINAFSKMYREAGADFPAPCGEQSYRRDLEAAYPIHPDLFRRLYDDWSTLDRFQRTRGVLRLLAKVIHRLWESQDASLLIMPASIPIDDPAVKSELTRYLEDVWEPIMSQDVDGPTSLPLDIDRQNPNLGRYSASRRVARTMYIGTAPGARGKNPGIDDRAVRLGCAQPGETPAVFGDALRRLADRGRYIHQDGNRYWLSTNPNMNRLAEDRATALLREPEALHLEIVRRLRADKERGDFAAVHVCPETTGDIPDETAARVVVLGPVTTHRQGQSESPALVEAKRSLATRGTASRINQNTLVFLAPDAKALDDLLQATAQYLAWTSIAAEEEKLNLDAFQRNQAKTKKKDFDETVDLRITATWIHLLVPAQPDPQGPIQWDALKATGSGGLAKRVCARLKTEGQLLPAWSAVSLRHELDRRGLWADKPHLRFADLAEWYPRYVYLSRVANRDVLEAAVGGALRETSPDDAFAIANRFDDGKQRYSGLRLAGTGGDVTVENTTLIVKPEIARAQVERERGASITTTGSRGQAPAGEGRSTTGDLHPTGGVAPARVLPRRFHGSVEVDTGRLVRDAGRIADEVVARLLDVADAKVRVTVEIEAVSDEGVPDDVVRTVTENCTTLKFSSHGFERE
ncbi:MAG: DUF499 domain-containing protein [Deltaproteobacteria bacterium]|nr:DUF499 domain-containing protein [Deltaproteobacteria bacterium]